jgi:hypothetical protein
MVYNYSLPTSISEALDLINKNKTYSFLAFPYKLSGNILSFHKIPEMTNITRSERYIEFGAACRLSVITSMGKIIPDSLSTAIKTAVNYSMRNLLRINEILHSLQPGQTINTALIALEARFELRTSKQASWVSLPEILKKDSPLLRNAIITRLRIPLGTLSESSFYSFNSSTCINIAFSCKLEKNKIEHTKMIVSSSNKPDTFFTSKDSDTFLLGRNSSLDNKSIEHYISNWKELLKGSDFTDYEIYKTLYYIGQNIRLMGSKP